MRVFQCVCGNSLFYGNTFCLSCQNTVGFCPECQQLSAFLPVEEGHFQCGHPHCGALLKKCYNYEVEQVCHNGVQFIPGEENNQSLCPDCQLTVVIPDLSIPGNRELWARLENAKRRVLYTLRQLNLPIGLPENGYEPKLIFDFAADLGTPVYTGHKDGRITVNLREADDVEREKARVAFQEPQRTLVGHIRHELGHYYWDLLIRHRDEEAFRAVFGDERNPTYEEALNDYYHNGPAENWRNAYISAYATMHPWEDFAESFGTYLDLVSVVETANQRPAREFLKQSFSDLLAEYIKIGGRANELNREMGLNDLVPEIFTPEVTEKLNFIHQLVIHASTCSLDGQPTASDDVPVLAQ